MATPKEQKKTYSDSVQCSTSSSSTHPYITTNGILPPCSLSELVNTMGGFPLFLLKSSGMLLRDGSMVSRLILCTPVNH